MQKYWILSAFTLTLALFLGNKTAIARTMIYGVENARHFNSHIKTPIYVQAASFTSAKNAQNYLKKLQVHCKYKVSITKHKNFHAVIIGPIPSIGEAKTLTIISSVNRPVKKKNLSQKLSFRRGANERAKTANSRHSLGPTNTPEDRRVLSKAKNSSAKNIYSQQLDFQRYANRAKSIITKSHGFLQADLGYTNSLSTGNFKIFNGAVDPYPANIDIYSINKNTKGGMASLIAGLRWQKKSTYLPAYLLALRYQNFFNQKIAGTIMQYSDPDFVNYNYEWQFNSNVFSVYSKVNLVKSHNLLPYVSAGIGDAINRSGHYQESPFKGVVARNDSPDFASITKNSFTYSVGAGFDYQIDKKTLISLGYEFQHLGAIQSGYGVPPWAAERLSLNYYRTNSVLISLNYLPKD